MAKEKELDFGTFIRNKRIDQHKTLLEVARVLEISNPYYCDIEKGNRNPPDIEKLNRLADFLEMTPDERGIMMDLAGRFREQTAPDINEWILATPGVSAALRQAKELDFSSDDWLAMVEEMKRRKGLK